ncbi:hypothetical protein [Methylocella sp.]|uniref:hypothetical protein n=1 Tax=Methylocella sp. TaxID=1978226 RepID=UPI0035B4E5A7
MTQQRFEMDESARLTPEQEKKRRQRNIAIALAIGFFVVLFYVVTIVKLGPGVFSRPI